MVVMQTKMYDIGLGHSSKKSSLQKQSNLKSKHVNTALAQCASTVYTRV